MRLTTLSFLLGITALAVAGCGGDSKSLADAGNSNDGAMTNPDGGAGAGVTTPSSCSNLPSCVAGFNQACPIEGMTCTKQLDTGTLVTNVCYSNGVKMSVVVDLTGGNSKGTVRTAGGAVCYTLELVPGSASSSVVYKNAAGQTLFTLTADLAGNAIITCPGASAVAVPKNCDGTPSGVSPNCPAGICAP